MPTHTIGGLKRAALTSWRDLIFPGGKRWSHSVSGASSQHRPARRRAHRVAAFLPVFVYGSTHDQPFAENTVTINVSSTGGFLALSADVTPSQNILMSNVQTNEELPCRIVRVLKTEAGKTLVGFEFLRPAPQFWSIDFCS
ncbi:MAG: PilZ domain-containing protein [Candidatus Acidiferrales bacterium]|jgi:c-di-GMP-binding flagellar brake protein YcgR